MSDEPKTRKCRIELTLTFDYDHYSETEEDARFYIEEHFCLDNYIDHLHDEQELPENEGKCQNCGRGKAKFIGFTDEQPPPAEPEWMKRIKELRDDPKNPARWEDNIMKGTLFGLPVVMTENVPEVIPPKKENE